MAAVTENVVIAVMAVFAVLLAITLIIGIAVAISPQFLERLRRRGEIHFSLRRATRVLDEPRHIDHIFYRYHRAYGSVVVALSIFLLYFLAFVEVRAGWSSVLGIEDEAVLTMLGTWARFILWLFAIFALMIGTIVFVRPSALKSLEQWANKWLTPQYVSKDTQSEYYLIDRGATRHPRLWGVIIATVSLVCLAALYFQWRSVCSIG